VNNRGASVLRPMQPQPPPPPPPQQQQQQQQQGPYQPVYHGYPPILQSRPFAEIPRPQGALTSTTDYLVALSQRMEKIFTNPAATLAARATVHPSNPPLTDADIAHIRETWQRLGSLIPYHTGGFYIPGTLSSDARHIAYTVLQSREFAIYHSDMQMSRFIIQFVPNINSSAHGVNPSSPATDPNILLTLTGWEHAFRAPLWACSRLPLFLTPRPIPNEPITWERQAALRNLIFFLMNDKRMLPISWQWIIGYVFGVPERWFEGCLGCIAMRLRWRWVG
jgi:hypothetical protein